MKTILIASFLAFANDPTGGTGAGGTGGTGTTTAPTCEDELLVCEDQREVTLDVLEAALSWAESLRNPTGGAAGGGTSGTSTQPTIGDIADACRLFGAPDLAKCVETSCSNLPGNCL